jgi:Rieske [2Fe-2S] domain
LGDWVTDFDRRGDFRMTSSTAIQATRVPNDNYVSREFALQERENLWPRVWQVACREEDIPNPGDYVVYDVADETIVVVRRPGGVIKAFHNVCPHRGRQIMEGCGHAVNFRCGYHNWMRLTASASTLFRCGPARGAALSSSTWSPKVKAWKNISIQFRNISIRMS